jgi:lipid II:glycine glycyltransferase (peptidoglycan interpeptide bridge formation enzyme)
MPEVPLDRWNEFLGAYPQTHFLQTGEWGELKSGFGWRPVRLVVGESGAQILFRSLPLGLTLGYIGKAAAQQIQPKDADGFWSEVDALCRRRRAILCKSEPDLWVDHGHSALPEAVLRPGNATAVVASAHSVQPRRTITVDLGRDEGQVLATMKQKCRYNIRLAEKKGVVVRPWRDVPAFHEMLVTTGRRDGFAVHSTGYYQRAYELFHPTGMCELLAAEFEGRPLAALMVFARGHRAWYVYGGSTDRERERMPNYLLQWEAMRWARGRGCEEYDLWGVPDEDESILEAGFEERQGGLWGVYRFKRGFGGTVRRAAQAVDRIYDPLLYRAYLLRASMLGGS